MEAEDLAFQKIWTRLVKKLEEQFGEGLDVEGIVYLVGLQQLGKGPVKLNKSQKMDLMHIAVCGLLARFGYYTFVGEDEDGWPHYEAVDSLPELKPGQQHRLIKEALVDYFREVFPEIENEAE